MKSRNRTLYIWSKIFFLSMIIDPIFILYACESGLNATQLFTLSSVQTLTIVLLEIPTGVIADLYGCKTSIILGSLAFILANIIYVTQPGFWGFLIAEILSGLYKVLFSGSDETYLYLELRRCNKENEYAKISGRIDSINFAGALSILTGYMYLLDRRLPFLVCLIFTTISLFCSFNLENLKENAHGQKSVGQTYSAYLQVIKNGTKSILTQKPGSSCIHPRSVSYWLQSYQHTNYTFSNCTSHPNTLAGFIFSYISLHPSAAKKPTPLKPRTCKRHSCCSYYS